MENVKGKVAFVTGGASGIGLGIAKVFAANEMKVVIIDSRQNAIDEAMSYFSMTKLPVHAIKLNVTDREAYVRAADEAESVFGKIHLLVNNAGVGAGGLIQNCTYKDWDFGLSVNLGGVINGVVTILPRILKHGEGGHIVATSSTSGIFAVGSFSIYNVTKAAVAILMETIATELQDKGIGASVLIPGATYSNLAVSTEQNRPAHLKNEKEPPPLRPGGMPKIEPGTWMDPVETGERVLNAIKRNDLFIITHPEFREGIAARCGALLRAIPLEPPNEKRIAGIKEIGGTLLYNPVYDKQTTPGPFERTMKK
jgi:NAD(P)-dependent dehydrogenase (short-subunit alcohol dehydrogenase family)